MVTKATHVEVSRSDAADAYGWLEETGVTGTQFDVGVKAVKRNAPADVEEVRVKAKGGLLGAIPADIYIRRYNSLRRIQKDHLVPAMREDITCTSYWV